MSENYLQSRGSGEWIIVIYNPSKEIGPFKGTLTVGRDYYLITDANGETIANIPSPNVSYCYNKKFV